MQPFFHILSLAVLAVAMVTSAPLTNQEKLVNVEQSGKSGDRAKRAQEEIVFGNQQNKARVVSKKSDISNILVAPVPTGELDIGSEVIVHKELPIHEDLADRAEAASGSEREQKEKIKEAVEAAIQSVAEDEGEKVGAVKVVSEKVISGKDEAQHNGQETDDVSQSDKKVITKIIEDEIEDGEHGTGEVSDVTEVKEEHDEDENLRNLEKGAVGAVKYEGGSNDKEEESILESNDEDVENFLQEKQEDVNESSLDRDREAFYEDRMRNYLLSLANKQNLPYISRLRRSLHHSKHNIPKKNHRGRRIKRDLIDDTDYSPYELQSPYLTPEDIREAIINDSEETPQLSNEESNYLNRKLEEYIANTYEPAEGEEEKDEEDRNQDESLIDAYLNGYDEPDSDQYAQYNIYSDDNGPYVSNPYDTRYPYGPIDFDSYQNYIKRSMSNYYPEEEEKRYFFPFSKEPDTHWGAFVPEKRDYDEAIQRLQRLAMALSDNPGPYYREVLEEYSKN